MSDVVKSFLVLIISVILVHLAYIGYVRPEAELILEAARQAGQSTPRGLIIIIKDYEQEICIILMLWGSFLVSGGPIRSSNTFVVFTREESSRAGSG